MKAWLILVPALMTAVSSIGQYRGGSHDGTHNHSSFSQNPLPSIYAGGANDGQVSITIVNQNALPSIYAGGINDGVTTSIATNQNILPNVYTGGSNDGLSMKVVTAQNALPLIYTGGGNDGSQVMISTNQNTLVNIYRGGGNDGYIVKTSFLQNPTCDGVNAIWTGAASTDWHDAANWACGELPATYANVIVPGGLSRYPVVSFSYEVRSITVEPGATITISLGVNLHLNGQ